MRLLFHNIKDGAKGLKKKFSLIKIVRSEQPDFVCYCEVDQWKKRTACLFSFFIGLPYFQITSFPERVKNLIIFSRYPIADYQSIKFFPSHGMLLTNIALSEEKELTIAVTHLTTKSPEDRERQAKKVLEILSENQKTLENPDKSLSQTILCGDFNAISPLQKYNDEYRQAVDQAREHVWKQLGTFEEEVNEKTLSILSHDLVDPFIETYKTCSTFPTKMLKDFLDVGYQNKIDYILASPDLSVTKHEIIKNPLTDFASDHYPVVIEW